MLDQTASPTLALHQRARGAVRLGFVRRGGATRLADLYQSGSAKAMLPRAHAAEPQATLINTAGGLTGGDAFDWAVTMGQGTTATIATQTAERAYRSLGEPANVAIRLTLGQCARLDWLAQETILFDRSSLRRRIVADLAPDARLTLVEPLTFGRAAMGENPGTLSLDDRWTIRREGRPVHIEANRLEGEVAAHRTVAGMGQARALATILYLGPDAEDRLGPARAALPAAPVRAAASAWDGRLVVRLMAPDAAPLRAGLIAFLTRFRGTALPRVWTM